MASEAERLLEGTAWLPEPLRTVGLDMAPAAGSSSAEVPTHLSRACNLAKVGVEGSNPFVRSSPLQTKFSPSFSGPQTSPTAAGFLRDRLGGSRAERYGESLSEGHFLSEAWGLTHLLYKLFSAAFQRVSLVRKSEGWHPIRLLFASIGTANRL